MGYSDALASIAAVSSAAAFYVLQMVTTQYSARLARRVARGWVGIGPLVLIALFVATIIWPWSSVGRILVLLGLATVVVHLWWVATSALSEQELLHAAVPRNAASQVLTIVEARPLPMVETVEMTEIVPVVNMHPIPKPWVLEPDPWPSGNATTIDPLLMLVDLLIGAVRQYNAALIDQAFEKLLVVMSDVIQRDGNADEYLALIFNRVIQASPEEGFIHDRINLWLVHAIVLSLPAGYPSQLLQLMKQQWARLWARRDMEHLTDDWSVVIHGMTTSSNQTWNVLLEWVCWGREWMAISSCPEDCDHLYYAWSRVFKQLCNLGLASADALQHACELAPYVIREMVSIPSMDTLPLSLIVALVETMVYSYRLDQLTSEHCMLAINGLVYSPLSDSLSPEWLSEVFTAVNENAFVIFALQANLPIDAYFWNHAAGDMAMWLYRHGENKQALITIGIAAMHTSLWGLPWEVFRKGIQAWMWYLARSQRIRPALSPYGTRHVGRCRTHQPRFIKTLICTSNK